jgi:nitrogen-specific signal transduction histidine kinase/CheY-like chemotaxis protein
VAIGRDITVHKQLERQLEIRQRMDSLGTLAGGIAHDFNNLLTGIIGYLDILLNINNEGLSENQKEYIENALISCHRAADLVKQFQTLSKDSISEKFNIDLYEASTEVFGLLEKTTDKLIDKKIDFKPGEFYINTDPSELNQVLLNLGTNAVKAIEKRGIKKGDNIRIRAKEYSITGKDRTGLTEGEYVHIFFEDNGIGMPDKVRRQAFDPLFTTSDKSTQKGLGLGLAMVYNIVTRSFNGSIDIETVEGKGTTFHIYLPKAPPLEQAEPKEIMGVVGGNETVLIVEDEEMVLNLAKEVLNNFGYNVLTALDGRQGMDIFNKNKEHIDLVLLDLTMPEMSGQTVLDKMLKINPDVKVIISSGHSQEDTRKGIFSKVKGYVSKPYKTKDLAQTVRTVLDL